MSAKAGEELKPFQLPITKAWAVGSDETHLYLDQKPFSTRKQAQAFCDRYNDRHKLHTPRRDMMRLEDADLIKPGMRVRDCENNRWTFVGWTKNKNGKSAWFIRDPNECFWQGGSPFYNYNVTMLETCLEKFPSLLTDPDFKVD